MGANNHTRICTVGCELLHSYPTNPFTFLELQNPSFDAPEYHKIRGYPDLKSDIKNAMGDS